MSLSQCRIIQMSPSKMSPSQMSPTPIIKDKRRTTKIKDIRSIYVIKWLFSQRQRTDDKKKVSSWFIRILFKDEGRGTKDEGGKKFSLFMKLFFQGRRTKDEGRRAKRKKIRMIDDYDSWGFSPKGDWQIKPQTKIRKEIETKKRQI